jgi:hypothetical protein
MEFTVPQGFSLAVNRWPPLKTGQMMTPGGESCRRVMFRRDPCTNSGKQNGETVTLCLETSLRSVRPCR